MNPELENEGKVSAEVVLEPGADGVQPAPPDEDADNTTDIDPAEFFDPEEFGYERSQGRFHHHERP